MSVLYTIARPYAKAIFEIALDKNLINEWKEMLIFIKQIASSKKIKNFLSGSLSPAYLSSIFIFISGDKINKDAKNLIKLLAKNQRFKILDNILEQFLELEALQKNIKIIELKSAFLLKDDHISKITQILEKFFLKKIKLVYKVDYRILGGIIITINNTVFDLSACNRLKQLSNALNF